MRKFIERALNKLGKLDKEQIRSLILDIASENELLEIVLESMTDGVVVLDLDHAIILRNKAAERLLPLRKDDAAEKPFWTSVSDDELSDFFHDKLKNDERVHDKQFALDLNGMVKILSCSIMPLARGGEALGNLIHIEDVTERKGKEARLRRAENLASLTTLAAGVAHEIKNPLGSIGIHIQLIQKELKNRAPSEYQSIEHYLDVVMEEVDRLNGIVVDFLFAVRPMNTNLTRGDLTRLVRDTLNFVKYELSEAHIEIDDNLDSTLPDIDIDEKYVKQALLNVIKNAISAMPDGGVLTLASRLDGNEICLTIADTGVGIPEEHISKIFEPYFTTKEFGSGLGLTVVYKIMQEHGGEVAVSTREGEGTTFTLIFPVPESARNLIRWEEKVREV